MTGKIKYYILNLLRKFAAFNKGLWAVFIIFMSLPFFLTSCEKAVNWELKHDNKTLLVVDGILTNELKPQQLKLYFSVQNLNDSTEPASGAIIQVTDSVNIFNFEEDINNPGTYISSPFIAVVGRNYNLTIQTDSLVFKAQAYAVPVTSLKELNLDKDSQDSLYSYINIEDSKPSMTELLYNWSTDTAYCHSYGYCQAAETYYSLNNVDVNKAFGPEKQKIKFPKGTLVIRKKYSLTEEHQAFLRSLLMETEWRGGLFDVQQGNVITNISNGAVGYFAVCMVVCDTVLAK